MLNRVILMGRLVADPELRQTQGGISVATFRVAVERNYQSKDSKERQADFISCVAWRKTGEFISQYFQKGRMIALEGSLQTRNYEDKQGQKRTAYEVIVDQAYFADSKPAGAQSGGTTQMTQTAANTPPVGQAPKFEMVPEDDLPFDDGDLPF